MAVVADKVIVEIDAKQLAAEVVASLAAIGEVASIGEHAQLRLRAVEIAGAGNMALAKQIALFLIEGRYAERTSAPGWPSVFPVPRGGTRHTGPRSRRAPRSERDQAQSEKS